MYVPADTPIPWLSPSTVVRAANGLSNSRSTLITVMPASIAFVATGVSAAPSNGSRTMASTFWLMNVSTWLICRFTSFVPSATINSTSEYFLASAWVALVMAPIQPWSAAGAEKPILTFLPGSSFLPAAWFAGALLAFSSAFGVLLVQAARAITLRPAIAVLTSVRAELRDIFVLLL